MTNVLAALEMDACATPVLRTAIALAKLLDATVAALHVTEHGAGRPERLARATGVQLREVGGEPIAQIIAASESSETAAVVLGSRGATGGPRPAGHTALAVITQVPKPIAVVPPQAQPPQRITRLLVPLDGTIESSRALEETIKLAHRHRLEILVLHVHSPATVPAFSDHEPHATETWDQEFLTRHIAAPHEHVTLLRHRGTPAEEIAAVAAEASADLAVLAWSQRLGEGRAHVVAETLAGSSIPVLLLPVPRGRARQTRPRG